MLIVVVFLLTIIIGLRYQVGGDWNAYLNILFQAKYNSFFQSIQMSDPGYMLFNWIAVQTFEDIWVVNLFCGLFFSIGLVIFARNQPRPWLALLVSVPYLIIVVAMGYSRQGVAIGLAMIALVSLERTQSTFKFVAWLVFAALFHKTAVMLVPLAALSSNRGRIWTILWIGVATLLLYFLFLDASISSFETYYIDAEYQSQGASVRVAMNALPALLFLGLRARFKLAPPVQRLWTNMALLAIGFIPLLILSPSSTAVDRMALYVIPLQIFVFSRLPEALWPRKGGFNPITLGVVGYSGAVQFVWLNFADFAFKWVPYQFFPLV